jgi:hypothetical protein
MARAAPFFVEQPVTCNVTRNVFKEPSNEKILQLKSQTSMLTGSGGYKENYQNNLPVKLKYTYTIQAGCALPLHLLQPRGLYPKKFTKTITEFHPCDSIFTKVAD